MNELGLGETIDNGTHLESPGILSAWGSAALSSTDFIFNPFGRGWQIDRTVFESACIEAAAHAGTDILRGVCVHQVRRINDMWEVETSCGRMVGRYLLDATGKNASVAKMMGNRYQVLDRMVSVHVRTNGKRNTDVDTRTLIEACQDGWWYTALTPSGRRTIAFLTDSAYLKGQPWQHPQWFMQHLDASQFVGTLVRSHDLEIAYPAALTSAHTGRMTHFSGSGWMAIGDAAISRDPLSGQGMLKALESAIDAARVLQAGSEEAIRRYGDKMEKDWNVYVRARSNYYALENRWQDKPFWQRRKQAINEAR